MQEKHHFRKVYKSDHLGVADLEDLIEQGQSRFIFTIREVRQENTSVAGKQGNYNIAYFVEPIKPWALNATNAKIIKGFAGGSPFVEDWKNIPVELYIDQSVKMKGEVVGGVRVKPQRPQLAPKPKPEFTAAMFEKAHAARAKIEAIRASYTVTAETEKQYLDYVAKNS